MRLWLALLCLSTLACMRPQPLTPGIGEGLLVGAVLVPEGRTLPADSVLEVWVTDESALTSAVPVLTETAFLTNRQPSPIAFTLRYLLNRVDPSHTYLARAVVRHEGQIIYASSAPVRVLQAGGPDVTLSLAVVGEPPA